MLTNNDNTLIRSVPCERCGERMLWTQAAWPTAASLSGAATARAAYQCLNGHTVDPSDTAQCPGCGVHDTARVSATGDFACRRCGTTFTVPR